MMLTASGFVGLVCALLSVGAGNNAAAETTSSKSAVRVAIVGAGIGGSSAAWYVSQELANAGLAVEIDVFESSQRTCGRMMAGDLAGQRFELGAAVAHPKNQYMGELLEVAGLKKLAAATGEFGLVLGPGQYVSLGDATHSWSEDFHLLERYGRYVVELDLLLEYLFNEFSDIYRLQSPEEGRSFDSLPALLEALPVNFTRLCRVTFADYLKGRDLPERLVDELVSATVQAVYNQDGRVLTALAGMTSLARSANDQYWSVLGGNELLCSSLLAKINDTATVHLSTPVIGIRYVNDTSVLVTFQHSGAVAPEAATYDAVILAAPLADSHIQLQGFPQPPLPPLNPGTFQQTTTTLIKGEVNLSYFGLGPGATVPWLFAMPAGNGLPLTLIENTPPVDGSPTGGGVPVWKLQSTASLIGTAAGRAFLAQLFPNATLSADAAEHTFVGAYPHFTAPDALGPLRLGKRLFYSSGIEWASSAMEMSCIAAKNSALLLAKELAAHTQSY